MAVRVTNIEQINSLAELERIGVRYEPVSEEEVRIQCPVHADDKPSACLNVRKNVWICQASGCKTKGDIIGLLALLLKVERGVVLVDLSSRYDLGEVKEINPRLIEKYHSEINLAGPLLAELRKRGITDDDIRRHRIGYCQGRITIPVYDAQNRVVNVRRYLPGAPGPEKMQNTKGYGEPRIYGIDQFDKFSSLWLCGGEMKAIVAQRLLNPHGIGAFAITAGEGAWEKKWQPLLKGKKLYICYDVDHAGEMATKRAGAFLEKVAEEVRIIDLPLDKEKYPKGDINDYVGQEKATDADLLRLHESSRVWSLDLKGTKDGATPEKVQELPLAETTRPHHIGHRVSFEAVATAMDTTPFIIPRKIAVSCSQDQRQCSLCPVFGMTPDEAGLVEMEIGPTSVGVLEMVNSPLSKQKEIVSRSLHIPPCKVVGFKARSYYRVHDTRLTPQISIKHEAASNVVYPAFILDADVEMNTPYKFTAVSHPHPKTAQATLLIDGCSQTEDSLDTFAPTAEELAELTIFQPNQWTLDGLQEKLDHIYTDLEANVTRIFQRRDLHILLDLCYHSVLVFSFEGRDVPGWVNGCVVGDSGQGKSETANRLIDHYGVGERVDCKNATIAGLLGGLQQIGTRWFVSWGVIPTHDRHLVILEEAKGASVELIGRLTDMRSRGIAEIPKIERRRAHARTRLCFFSNPRSSRQISSFNFGLEAIKELIGQLEDIRRFDLALVVSGEQIDSSVINQLMVHRPVVEQTYTSDLCRRLILFGWTVKPDNTKFQDDAMAELFQGVVYLCSRFSESIPLIDRGTTRFKLARLAIALAVRTYSVENGVVIVRKCHVEYVIRFLDRVYTDPVHGYYDYSKARGAAQTVLDERTIRATITSTKHPRDLVASFLYREDIAFADIQDWCEVDKEVAQKLLSFFVRKHCLHRDKQHYTKTPEFIELLKSMQDEKLLDEPSHEGDEM